MIVYTKKNKADVKHNDNYVYNIKRDCAWDKVNCWDCIFVGENASVSRYRLCARHMAEIAEVNAWGKCDKGRSRFKWYNRINFIKKRLLKRSGFVLKNR